MDEILFKALEIHFLEPQVSFDIKTKIKPAITNSKKQDNPKDAMPRYMQAKGEKPPVAPESKVAAFAHMTAAQKRQDALEVKPKLNLALKL